jgi:endonuclease/exonuclease/phosphatase family metal-dependent hydrolase
MVLGDFNLIKAQENRNKPGENIEEMFLFNEAISTLGLNEIPLQNMKYTWSNMQDHPLLEKLDCVFTSNSWTLSYPNTLVKRLSREPSDHCPCLISISTSIPRGKISRFENYWMNIEGFQEIGQTNCVSPA